MIDEQKLRELCSNATPGPWSFVRHTCGLNGEHDARDDWTVYGADGDSVCTEGSAPALADPEFITATNPATITALLDELATLRSERTAFLVNEQNLREELEALRASLGEPVAVIGRDYQLLWARRDWSEGLNVGVNLYALSNKETP